MQGLFFDGRRDKTIVTKQMESKNYRKTVLEEHIALIHEPGSEYIGHILPSSGAVAAVVKSLFAIVQQAIQVRKGA